MIKNMDRCIDKYIETERQREVSFLFVLRNDEETKYHCLKQTLNEKAVLGNQLLMWITNANFH